MAAPTPISVAQTLGPNEVSGRYFGIIFDVKEDLYIQSVGRTHCQTLPWQ